MQKRAILRMAAGVAIAAFLSACGNSVTFRLYENYTPVGSGSLNLKSGKAEVDVGKISYTGNFHDGALLSPAYVQTLKGPMRGSDGSVFECVIGVEKNGTGTGECTGPVTYRVKLRDPPHM